MRKGSAKVMKGGASGWCRGLADVDPSDVGFRWCRGRAAQPGGNVAVSGQTAQPGGDGMGGYVMSLTNINHVYSSVTC
jgi:hypothetical protein